jgi:agmatine/peptidylarginine deiminase
MPIQVDTYKYVQYRYNPDYLRNNESFITNPDKCCKLLGIESILTDVVIDGGNVIKCQNCIIMTDKIVKENPNYSQIVLINQLENLFQSEIVIIPWDKHEKYGHADGMVRYIRNNRLLLNNYMDFDNSLRKKLINALSSKFEIIELHYDVKNPSLLNWAYINFLQIGNLILLPSLDIEEDSQALTFLKDIFKLNFEQVNVSDIVKMGGALNCISWNVKANNGILTYHNSCKLSNTDKE